VDQAKRLKELEQENSKLKRLVAELSPDKLLSPERRCTAVEHAKQHGPSERHTCQLVHQPRGRQCYQPTQRNDEDALTRAYYSCCQPAWPLWLSTHYD
jgi:hypothetical protein